MMSLAKFFFNRSLISERFDVFKEAWNEVLSADTIMTAADFEKFWDWLKWVVSTEGVTENNQTKATYFESYKSFGLDKTFVFETLKEILPEINDCLNKISFRELSRSDPYGLLQLDLAAIARAFKVSTPNGFVYFFACREWFYNRIMPIFVNFARRIEIAGSSFERDMQKPSSFYSKFGVAGGEKSALGLMIEPRLSGHPTGQKTSRSKLPKIRRSKRNTRLQTTKKIRDLKSITFKRKTIAGKGLSATFMLYPPKV